MSLTGSLASAHTNLSEGHGLFEVDASLLWDQLLSPWRQGRQARLPDDSTKWLSLESMCVTALSPRGCLAWCYGDTLETLSRVAFLICFSREQQVVGEEVSSC